MKEICCIVENGKNALLVGLVNLTIARYAVCAVFVYATDHGLNGWIVIVSDAKTDLGVRQAINGWISLYFWRGY